MRAIRLHEFGPADNLRLDTVPDLVAGPGEVRIAVRASGVHLLDTTLRRGERGGPWPQPALPTVPGREVAGIVDGVGSDVPRHVLGRRVVAHLGQLPGGYAEQAITTPEKLIDLPTGVTHTEAVALVGTGRTALGILEQANLTADDVVLIPAAAGGLGWLLVQAARTLRARVIAAAGGAGKLAMLEQLAPHQLVDYSSPSWPGTVIERPTVVLDGVGGSIGRQAMQLLRPGGRLLMFGHSAGEPTRVATEDLVAGSLTASWSLGPRMLARPGGIQGLAREAVARAGAGEWRALLTEYPLAKAAQAHRDLEERRTVGKVVLIPAYG
jgi:NADPH:quinone reductase